MFFFVCYPFFIFYNYIILYTIYYNTMYYIYILLITNLF
jgi:hypothetical protein